MPPGIEQVYLVYPVSAFKSRTTGEKLPVRPVPSARRYRLLLCIVAVRQRMRASKSTRGGAHPAAYASLPLYGLTSVHAIEGPASTHTCECRRSGTARTGGRISSL